MIITLDKDYELKCTLGTIREIEQRFNKGFYTLMRDIEKMSVSDQLKLIYVGIKKAGADISEQNFSDLCDKYMGMGELTELLEKYLLQLQYPGLSTDEIKDRIQKKLQKATELNAANSLGNI